MMKKRFRLSLAVFLALLLCVPAFSVSAADNVVFLSDSGTGDGSSPDKATNDLFTAYENLDLTKNCTIVICGVFTQQMNFNWCEEYTGSVTFTSVYGGKDYRTEGASYQFKPGRFVCWGDTRFENMDFVALGTNLLVIGQHHPLTVGEGVTMTGASMTGENIGKAFCLLGGYQSGQDDPPFDSDKDVNITVLSGSSIYIVPFSRTIAGNYTGTAHIRIGGNAQVSVLHGSAAYPDGVVLGKVDVTVEENAHIDNFYGCTNNVEMESFTLTWLGGTFGGNDGNAFEWCCHYTPGKTFTATKGTLLRYGVAVKSNENFAEIAAIFDRVEETATEAPETTAAPVTTEAPVTTAAPATTVPGAGESTPDTGDAMWVIVAAALASAAMVVMITAKAKKKTQE